MSGNESRAKVVFLCGGQGAQYFQMGKELFGANAAFRACLLRGEEIFHGVAGESLLDVIFDPCRRKSDSFDQLEYTHPAIFLIQYALAQALAERGLTPDLVVGCSLGEFAAAAISGLAEFEDALVAVMEQADRIVRHCDEAGMTAILDGVELFDAEPALFADCELAAVNYARHFVISASRPVLARVEKALQARNALHQRLPVRYGFHSSWIALPDSARAGLALKPAQARVPIWSSAAMAPVSRFDADHGWRVLRSPIRFAETLQSIPNHAGHVYVDLSPSGTLSAFARNVLGVQSQRAIFAAMSPYGNDAQVFDAMLGGVLASEGRRFPEPSC
ncbi:acyltransferase domain-containing protein [Chromobacterium sp. ATCC 53434]|uniref:acyltransferase domain-containing protein n=1 Tax=Chromobacterium sp. (strain ATCC 53434 / SC 14030) TaxID=2059672 RepID=UPI00130532F4|nr:acyltransferase domain-containing protein [Chromobacterium sp. ATCC 53434]